MIDMPVLTEQEQKEIEEILTMPGWKHIYEPIIFAINEKATRLIDWRFERGDDDEILKKSLGNYERIQNELTMLKEFVSFIQKGGIMITEDDEHEIFENTSK